MAGTTIEQIGQTQRERLFHIDFCALFAGLVRRSDLTGRFGIAEAAATRDLALYRSLAPDNLAYDAGPKLYRATAGFAPLFPHDPGRSLHALSDGVGDDSAVPPAPHLPAERPLRPAAAALPVVAAVSRAILGGLSLRIRYVSLTSGWTERRISPHALVDNGLRWHARAHDDRSGGFRDFLLTRIGAAEPAGPAPAAASRERDEQWMRIVHLHLVPHPGLAHPEAVAADFGMDGGQLHLRLRAPLVGYVARAWGIDTSPDHSGDPGAFPLWLTNRETLYGVESLHFAPGG